MNKNEINSLKEVISIKQIIVILNWHDENNPFSAVRLIFVAKNEFN